MRMLQLDTEAQTCHGLPVSQAHRPSSTIMPHAGTAPSTSGRAPVVVAIDGPAASGKGTLSKQLAAACKLAHLDTGLLYRALGYKALQLGVALDNEQALVALGRELSPAGVLMGGLPCHAANPCALMPHADCGRPSFSFMCRSAGRAAPALRGHWIRCIEGMACSLPALPALPTDQQICMTRSGNASFVCMRCQASFLRLFACLLHSRCLCCPKCGLC